MSRQVGMLAWAEALLGWFIAAIGDGAASSNATEDSIPTD
jgi:hypothetical protein